MTVPRPAVAPPMPSAAHVIGRTPEELEEQLRMNAPKGESQREEEENNKFHCLPSSTSDPQSGAALPIPCPKCGAAQSMPCPKCGAAQSMPRLQTGAAAQPTPCLQSDDAAQTTPHFQLVLQLRPHHASRALLLHSPRQVSREPLHSPPQVSKAVLMSLPQPPPHTAEGIVRGAPRLQLLVVRTTSWFQSSGVRPDTSAPVIVGHSNTTEGQRDTSDPAHATEGLGNASGPAPATEGLCDASGPASAVEGLGEASTAAHASVGQPDAPAPVSAVGWPDAPARPGL
ncbi:hypothetical protein CRENBAI_002680 [Crenichthys baileyi]|uniref:Uncharacterized protein n=1 Tax=Crenichthys baileyi TaxID=28760 RepID=A0AAV9SFD3_9TELE